MTKAGKGRVPQNAAKGAGMKHVPLLILMAIMSCVVYYNYARFTTRVRTIHHPATKQGWAESLVVQENSSPRCKSSGLCWNAGCGEDGLGCVVEDTVRREKVVSAIKWSWEGYRKYAWGTDSLLPYQQQGEQWMNLGLTIVDSLDTLLVAGLTHEFKEAREWVQKKLDVDNTAAVSVFETNIRVLGGLLSAYYWNNGDQMFLKKAVALAERLMPAFKTPHKLAMPYLDLAWGTVPEHKPSWMQIREGTTTLADAGSLSLEFSTVSYLTGRPRYGQAATDIFRLLHKTSGKEGLHCNSLFLHTLMCASSERGVGGGADSTYEYMLKQWLLSGKKDQTALKLYKRAMRSMREQLLDEAETAVGRLTYVGVLDLTRGFLPTMEHLVCFLPGLLALGHYHGVNTALSQDDDDDLDLAKKLMYTCNELYRQSVTGLAPEAAIIGPHTLQAFGRRARPLHAQMTRFDNGQPIHGRKEGASWHSLDDDIRSSIPDVSSLDVVDLLLLHKWWGGSQGLNATHAQLERMLDSGELGWMSGEHKRSLGEALNKPLSGEGVYWTSQHKILLRPETVESLYILYRVTKDLNYKHWAWQIFRAFNMHCNVTTGGYTTLDRGDVLPPWRHETGSMPSFWLAETLKYLYLMFDEAASNRWGLDKVVFNTEAHPLPVHLRPWQEQAASQI